MFKTYKYRLLPNEQQKGQLSRIFGCVRLVYNLSLETKNTSFASGKAMSCFDLIKQLPDLKNEFEWLKDTPSQAYQMTIRNLDVAFTNFFKGRANFPKFKSKYSKQSFSLPQGVTVDFESNEIKLPKLGKMDCIFSRNFEGKIKTVTVSKTPTNKYFVSILVDTKLEAPIKRPKSKDTAVGLDLGIKDFCITSDGDVFKNQRHFQKMEKILAKEQRSLSRKKKGSKRREKQRLKVALIHEKISNRRLDLLHKTSTYLINKYDTICIEDLNVSTMLDNKVLAKHIQDCGWRTFRTFLEYKAEWYGKNINVIGRFEPSSKMCSNCGSIKSDLSLKDRFWTCKSCNTELDRDINAALNILNFSFVKNQNAGDTAISSKAQTLV